MLQLRWFRIFGLAFIGAMVSLTLVAQGDLAALQQKLNSQFKLTTITANQLDIVTAGDVVTLQKDGLKMSALAAPLMESNTYKDGKIGGGAAKRAWGGLGVAMLQGMAAGLDPSGMTAVPDAIPGHTAASGEKFWVLAAMAQKDGITFKLYSDPDGNGTRYHANLKVVFPNKKQMPPVDAAMQLVAELLAVVPAGDQESQPAKLGPLASLAGEYLLKMTGTRFVLRADGSCSIQNPGVSLLECNSILDGDWIRVTTKIGKTNFPMWNLKMQGDKLYLNGATEIVRQGAPAAPDPQVAPAPAPAPMPEIAPPPPPADAAPTVSIGQTKDQVTAAFGQPDKTKKVGTKEIYYYKDMKVTFTSGKVSDVD